MPVGVVSILVSVRPAEQNQISYVQIASPSDRDRFPAMFLTLGPTTIRGGRLASGAEAWTVGLSDRPKTPIEPPKAFIVAAFSPDDTLPMGSDWASVQDPSRGGSALALVPIRSGTRPV